MNLRGVIYGSILFIIVLVLEFTYPKSLVFGPLLEPHYSIYAAFIIWQGIYIPPTETANTESHPISIVNTLELLFSCFIGVLVFLITIFTSGYQIGYEAVISNLHLIFLGASIITIFGWFFGSLVPRFLYNQGFLKGRSIEPRKPGEPLGKLFG